MDFLEGSLLGPKWSDTEYETKRHRFLFLLMYVVFYCLVYYFFSASLSLRLQFITSFFPVFAILLFLGSFLLYSRYYSFPFPVRILTLLFCLIRNVCVLSYGALLFSKVIRWITGTHVTGIYSFLDETITYFVEQMSHKYQILGLAYSGTMVGLLGFIFMIVFILFSIFLPLFLVRLVSWLQSITDTIMLKMFKKNLNN